MTPESARSTAVMTGSDTGINTARTPQVARSNPPTPRSRVLMGCVNTARALDAAIRRTNITVHGVRGVERDLGEGGDAAPPGSIVVKSQERQFDARTVRRTDSVARDGEGDGAAALVQIDCGDVEIFVGIRIDVCAGCQALAGDQVIEWLILPRPDFADHAAQDKGQERNAGEHDQKTGQRDQDVPEAA
jgi:hypothetical protein